MLNFIDISSHQGNIDLSKLQGLDAVIVKATEGTNYVNPYCDPKIQQAISLGKPFGFYHYGRNNDPIAECDFFIKNTQGYDKKGIPVLDWEEDQSVDWVNRWVRHYHERTGVWPWIYANPWRFNKGGVEQNCGRWVASYPNVSRPGFGFDPGDIPRTDGLVCAWQYASDGNVPGYSGNLDINHFYGDAAAWRAYTGANTSSAPSAPAEDTNKVIVSVLENDEYKITVERK